MQQQLEPQALSDDDLLRRVLSLMRRSRVTEAEIVAHIGEVDARRLYAREACSSMFAYCTEVLHFSEAEAYLRIAAARASREHAPLLAMLADGRLHLSAIERLAPHLTPENRDRVLARAAHRTKRQVEELVAELAPRPDAPALVRRLPARVSQPGSQARDLDVSLGAAAGRGAGSEMQDRPEAAGEEASAAGGGIRPESPLGVRGRSDDADGARERPAAAMELRLAGAGTGARPESVQRAVVLPTAPGRYKVQFTAGAELREKLERLQALMRRTVPGADLAWVIEQAVSEKLERLEAARFGMVRRPRAATPTASPTDPAAATATTAVAAVPAPAVAAGPRAAGPRPVPTHGKTSPRRIPAAIRRAVHARDGGRCRYTDRDGRRCTARHDLEFHHRHPFGYGGAHNVDNLCLACPTHNRMLGESDYGRLGPQRPVRAPASGPNP